MENLDAIAPRIPYNDGWMKNPLLVACDFDGTVTQQDTLVEILNAFGSDQWRRIQEEVLCGQMSIREGLQREMGSVRATPEQLQTLLTSRIGVEPSFLPFLQNSQRRGIPLVCLSGGFDLCVETVLKQAGLSHLPYLANRLIPLNGTRDSLLPESTLKKVPGTGTAWRVEFPYPSLYCSACGHCKGDPIRTWNAQGYTTLFVGNGVTDRCAARQASVTFAKGELADWCRSQGIEAIPYVDFGDVQKELTERGWL